MRILLDDVKRMRGEGLTFVEIAAQFETNTARIRNMIEPEKYKARSILNSHVARKLVSRPLTCEQCGAGGQIDGHHPNYSMPLAVVWLCVKCHSKAHKQMPKPKTENGKPLRRAGRPKLGLIHRQITIPPAVESAMQAEAKTTNQTLGQVVTRWHDVANKPATCKTSS